MRVLDLFCGAGGAAIGYYQAGFEVVGVDIEPQPRYPFDFVQGDAMRPPVDLRAFDFIHASPPCQGYTQMRSMNETDAPRLIKPLRKILRDYPYVIENVVGSPLMGTQLCGTSFDLRMWRHRLFESNFHIESLACRHDPEVVYINPYKTDGRKAAEEAYGDTIWRLFKRELGLEYMTDNQASEAIPPAYTKYIGEQFLANR